MNKAALLLCLLLLVSCAGFYPQPSENEPHAVLQGEFNRQLRMEVGAMKIDGKRRFPVEMKDAHRVTPGMHEIVFSAASMAMLSKASMTLDLKAGHHCDVRISKGPSGYLVTVTDSTTTKVIGAAPAIPDPGYAPRTAMDDTNAIMMGAMSSSFR